jgi:putative ABC transport system permease protein
MMRNYFKQAWRSLQKNKTYSILNISGLAAGLTCFIFIALWVSDEISYDKFNRNYDRIVRLTSTEKTESGISESAVSSAPMAKALKNDYAEVENTVRLKMREELITYKGQQVLQPGILMADPSFFNVFSYSIARGNVASALNEPYSVILTESTAKKYFGDTDPMGQTLLMNMYDSTGYGAIYKVTGVMPDPPKNAHFTFNMLVSFKTIEVANPDVLTVDGWGDNSFYTYLLLKKGVDKKAFSAKITQFYGKYIGELYNIWKSIYFYKLQPLADIHLHSNLQNEIGETGNINQVYIFSAIGIFILLLAAINYMNLATARSVNRAKEVGVKKVLGALKKQLIAQFLLEAVLTAAIALVISFLLSFLLQPLFFQVANKKVLLFSSPLLVIFLIAVAIIIGLLSGLYPAFIISRFQPARVLKGVFKSGNSGIALRRFLVIAQFTITLVLIIGIVVINSQMSFIKHKDLGYNKDELLFLKVNGNTDVIKGYNAFKNELRSSPLISGVATSNSMIAGGLGSGGSETVDITGNPLQVNTSRLRVDADYLNVYGIKLLAGKVFSKNASSDTIRQVILNEMAVKKFGWKNDETAIGKSFKMGNQKGMVIGVVNNFHFNSLQQGIEPLAIYPVGERFSRITVKVDIKKTSEVVELIENTWKKHFPSALFDYDFVSQQIKDQYQSEERFSKIFEWFSILSVVIACLGLYGLISYAVVQKTKEIGIRKILGATTNGIALMLSTVFLKLVVLAFIVASPIAWFIMNKWLQDFAYRTTISWWMFVIAGSAVLLLAVSPSVSRRSRPLCRTPLKIYELSDLKIRICLKTI